MIKPLLRLGFYFLPLILFLAHVAEPRAEMERGPNSRADSLLPKAAMNKNRQEPANSLDRATVNTAALRGDRPTTREVKSYVRTQAGEYGVDPKLALWIVKHESSFNPRAKGDGETSRGLWQISSVYHPEVSDSDAFSVTSSTDWSLRRIRAGKVNEWSAYKNCRTLYADCPY